MAIFMETLSLPLTVSQKLSSYLGTQETSMAAYNEIKAVYGVSTVSTSEEDHERKKKRLLRKSMIEKEKGSKRTQCRLCVPVSHFAFDIPSVCSCRQWPPPPTELIEITWSKCCYT